MLNAINYLDKKKIISFSFNGGYIHGSIRNDTQRDAPNNRTTVLTSNNRSLSPNNSLDSHGPWSIRRYTVTPNQVSGDTISIVFIIIINLLFYHYLSIILYHFTCVGVSN